MKNALEALGLAIITVFAPIKSMLIVTAVLVVVDLITGVLAARKQGIPITSSGFKRTLGKIFLYEVALCLSFLVHQYLTGDLLPAEKLVSAMIGLVELKSCLENLDTINGSPVFASILAKIVDTQNKKD